MRCIWYLSLVVGVSGPISLAPGQMQMGEDERLSAQDEHFFESRVRPLLIEHCYSCHAADAERIRGGLVLDSKEGWEVGGISGPAVIPGDPDNSLLIQSIRWTDEDFQMPPRRKLSDGDIATLEEWVRRGAPDPRVVKALSVSDLEAHVIPGGGVPKEAGADHWAFQTIATPSHPDVKDERWAMNEVDGFILATLEENDLRPAQDADKATLIRRLSFDIRGIPPTPEEIEAFEEDRSEDAYARLVDAFLASPSFGERWGRHWLDIARYAESSGKENDVPYPFAWRYRDWVIEALNEDKPYDDFIRAQIAGDLLKVRNVDEATDHLVATGYLAIGSKSHQERNRRQFALDVADEQIDTITQGLLGLTVSCARCHDHKYDPISQQDYYQLAGVFLSSETLFGGNGQTNRTMSSDLYTLPNREGIKLGLAMPQPIYDRIVEQTARTEREVERLEAAVQEAGRRSDAAQMLRNTNNRLAPLKSALARYDSEGQPTESMRVAMGMRDGALIRDANLLVRGELDKPGEVVPRGVPPIADLEESILVKKGSGRLDFAEWIVSESNPLTARVMANRIWLHLFGRGIVESTENFGLEGKVPSHPELLDYLASKFMEDDWSVKSLIREIVTSRAYQMSSRGNSRGLNIDPENTMYWRMSPRRLEAEAIRDAILVAAGALDTTPPVGSPISWATGRLVNVGSAEEFIPDNHRSVYMPIVRGSVPLFLDTFDVADPSFVTGDREETSVPSQALFLLNDDWVMKQADSMAKELLALRMSDDERVELAFKRTLGRKPSAAERGAIRMFFQDFGKLDDRNNAYQQPDLPRQLAAAGRNNSAERRAMIRRRLEARGIEVPETLTPREVAWSSFCQSLFACADFRYVQ